MISQTPSYRGYRFPPEIISHAVWLYHRFCLSFRDTEDLLAQRGITVSYETIRVWCRTFGPAYARTLRRRRGRMGDTWYLHELFVTIQGRQQYLWRAVDEDGDEIDILVQSRRNRRAAIRFFRKVLKGQGREPRRLVTLPLAGVRCRVHDEGVTQTGTTVGTVSDMSPEQARGQQVDHSTDMVTGCRWLRSIDVPEMAVTKRWRIGSRPRAEHPGRHRADLEANVDRITRDKRRSV